VSQPATSSGGSAPPAAVPAKTESGQGTATPRDNEAKPSAVEFVEPRK